VLLAHGSAIDAESRSVPNVFVIDEPHEPVVRHRIENALRPDARRVVSLGARALTEAERPLAGRLLAFAELH